MNKTNWMIYFDASALTKRYAPETGEALVNEVFRLVPSETHFNQALLDFNAEVTDSGSFLKISVDDNLIYSAIALLHAHNLNATDTVVLRAALNLRAALKQQGEDLVLWASDKRLARAARAEGITVFDPETETVDALRQLLGVDQQPSVQQ